MFASPYRIGVVCPEGGLTQQQQDWFRDHLRQRVTSVMNLAGSDAQVVVHVWRMGGHALPWVTGFLRPDHVQIWDCGPDWWSAGEVSVVESFADHYQSDEVLCFMAPGKGLYSRSAVARVLRYARNSKWSAKYKTIRHDIELPQPAVKAKPTKKGKLSCLLNLN